MQPITIRQSACIPTEKSIATMEKHLNAVFLFSVDIGHGMSHILYSENPDKEKGHGHYVAVIQKPFTLKVLVYNPITPKFKGIYGIVENGIFYYSSHRHDYVVTPSGNFIDGGTDYTRHSGANLTFMLLTEKGPVFAPLVEKWGTMMALKKLKTDTANLSVKTRKSKPIPFYECAGCRRVSKKVTPACDCNANPDGLYRIYRAFQTDDFVSI